MVTGRRTVDAARIKPYLILLVWVGSVTGAVAAREVVIVLVSDVFGVFGLRKEQILRTSRACTTGGGQPVRLSTYWAELALEIPELLISTITAKISRESGDVLEPEPAWWHKRDTAQIPFGVQLKDVVSIVAFICTGKTNPCRLCSTGSTCVAGKHSLSLHITLEQSAQGRQSTAMVTFYFPDKMTTTKTKIIMKNIYLMATKRCLPWCV